MRSPSAKSVAAVLCAALVAVLVAGCGDGGGARTASASPSASPSADPVVARVNGRDVRQSDVDLARAEARLVGQKDGAEEALQSAIDGALVGAEAERLGLEASAAEVDRRLAAVKEQLGGEAALDTALERTDMTLDQLRTSLAQGILREAVQNARYPDVAADAAAVRAFYRRNRAKLFTSPESVELAALVARNEGIAGNAVKRLKQGRPFAEVARQFSIDPELKASGGAMGWMQTTALPTPLRRAVAALRPGQTAPPTAGPGGVWVMKLIARRPVEVVAFAAVRAQIQKGLDGEKRSAALARWLEQAREDAQIERL